MGTLSSTCGTLSSGFLHPENFRTRGSSSSISGAVSKFYVCRDFDPQCKALGQSDCHAPEQRISAKDNPFVKPLSNIYFVVPCRLCQGLSAVVLIVQLLLMPSMV
jgi:hypothetical protein